MQVWQFRQVVDAIRILLVDLVVERKVAAITLNLVLTPLVYFFREVLDRSLEGMQFHRSRLCHGICRLF